MNREMVINDRPELQPNLKQEDIKVGKESLVANQEFIYSEQDLTNWEEGSDNYKKFINNVEGIEKYTEHEVGSLQAMFLGEKPAVLVNRLALDHKKELEIFGFKFSQDYCYKPELVKNILEKYKDEPIFSRTDPDNLMNGLAKADLKEQSRVRGLILGFPLSAVDDFDKMNNFKAHDIIGTLYNILPQNEQAFLETNFYTEKKQGNREIGDWIINKLFIFKDTLNIKNDVLPDLADEIKFLINSKDVNIHGVIWTDYHASSESINKQERLKKAFEKSGILNA